jgi:hypothetical protein
MGHDSTQAAIIYQDATAEADRTIAQAVDKALKAERRRRGGKSSGPARGH